MKQITLLQVGECFKSNQMFIRPATAQETEILPLRFLARVTLVDRR